MLNFITESAERFGLHLSPKKCELICFHHPRTVNKTAISQITLAGEVLKWKSTVVYLGSGISEDGRTTAAVKHRICHAESVVERLNERVFRRRAVSPHLKGTLSVLLYLCLCSTDYNTAHLVLVIGGALMATFCI